VVSTVVNSKNNIPISKPFEFPDFGCSWEEVGQLCGGN
jgi:hypothetical protein